MEVSERVVNMVSALKEGISFCSPGRKQHRRNGRKSFMNIMYSPGELQRYLGRESSGNIRKFYSKIGNQKSYDLG